MSTTRPDPAPGQRGFSTVAAIFILVVLAALGGFIVSTSSTQALTLALDVMNSRAQLAARAGTDWGIYQLVKASPAPAFRTDCEAVAASYTGATPAVQTLAAGSLSGLEDFSVRIECRSQSYNEAGVDYRVYQITATACNAATCPTVAPGLGYVEHQQVARVKQ